MATGLEAIGAASAILQVISFAGSVVSICYKIYDGQPTLENELEEYASQMIDATERVRDRSQWLPSGTSDEKKLLEIAQKCLDASKSLQTETQLMTRRYQKGRLFRAAYTAVRASSHRNKIKDLQNSLDKYKEVMETQLLLKICDKSTAIEQKQSQGFQNLDSDVQSLITQIAKGHVKIQNLVIKEAKTTRDELSTHVTLELQALGARAVSGSQRERLLNSLKVHEMNKRYHDVMDSAEASFERVFVSYERVCRKDPGHKAWQKVKNAFRIDLGWRVSEKTVDEIDQLWDSFSSWLQSNDDIFWIRGKPGSGKSTLFKFVVNNDNTKRLLDSWSPNTKILSHFFWKIGTEPQNSIKGLLCSLLYGVLCEDNSAIDQVLGRFSFSSSKDSYHDWSVRDLEDILFSVLGTRTYSACIFIDGLDEISDKDGFLKLMCLVEKLKSRSNLKVCVSSRPETQLVNRLESMRAKSLRLEDLTRPEMALNVHNHLKQFEEKGQISTSFLETSTTKLLEKADGVFLWIFLAMKSLIDGIENCDDEKTLLGRLEELPGELEALYEDMWTRMNSKSPVYRRTAGRYFRYVIADRMRIAMCKAGNHRANFILPGLFLAKLALSEELEKRPLFPPKTNDMSLADLKSLCQTATKNIHTRCAGMLQIQPHPGVPNEVWQVPEELGLFIQTVDFIHRTARDFLTDTEAGQRILNYDHNASVEADADVKLLKSFLCLAIVFAREFDLVVHTSTILEYYARFLNTSVDPRVMLGLLPIIEGLHEEGVLGDGRPAWCPRLLFLPLLASNSPVFDDFIISSLKQADSPRLATDVLREIVAVDYWYSEYWRYQSRTRLMQKIIMLGANPHAIGISTTYLLYGIWGIPQSFTQKITAFELFLQSAVRQVSTDNLNDLPAFVGVIDAMAQTCPDWHRKSIIITNSARVADRVVLAPWRWGSPNGVEDYSFQPWGACEVDLKFLLTRFLAVADCFKIPTHDSKLHELANSFTEPHVRLRYIAHHRPQDGEIDFCYRILAQNPFQGLIDYTFGSINGNSMTLDEVCSFIEALGNPRCLDSSVLSVADSLSGSYEKVPYEAELDTLAEEGLGLCRLSDVGIHPPVVDDTDTDSQLKISVESFSD